MDGLAVICLGIKGVVRVVRPWCDVCVASSSYMCVTHYVWHLETSLYAPYRLRPCVTAL